MAKKPEDYRVTRGKALIAERKRAAANPQKGVGLPSKKNVVNAAKQIGGAALMIAGPGKVVKGVQLASKVAKAAKTAKAATKVAKKASTSVKVSSNVKVIPGKMSPTSVRAVFVNEKLMSGANKARNQNAAKSTGSSKSTSKALKNVNNPKNSPLDSRGKPNVKALKAANKKVSKNNAGQTASKAKIDILKNAPPARANRTRGGKSVPKFL